jgi:hypothetical protein
MSSLIYSWPCISPDECLEKLPTARYKSTGNSLGNAFGLAAVCAVYFPIMFFARLYWPYPPMTMLILLVTSALVFGYSYQDHHIKSPANPGVGFEVAWVSHFSSSCLVCSDHVRYVSIETVRPGDMWCHCSFVSPRSLYLSFLPVFSHILLECPRSIFSLIPPSTTIRRYQRATLATTATVTELAAIYCAVLSYSHTRTEEESHEISVGLLAIRSKLNRSAAVMANVVYEVRSIFFVGYETTMKLSVCLIVQVSLRGQWPADRYNKIMELQL